MNELVGLRIVTTRAREQMAELADPLREHGAEVIEIPTIEITDPADGGAALHDALVQLHDYAWCVFTSVNTVSIVLEIVNAELFHGVSIAAIGDGTARALESRGLFVDLIPDEFVAESFVTAFPVAPTGGKVLLPCAVKSRKVLPDGLRAKGWFVDVVAAYDTISLPVEDAKRKLAVDADVITFASPFTANSYLDSAGIEAVAPVVACIGPVTEDALLKRGVESTIVAAEHSIVGLVNAIIAWRSVLG